MKIFLHSQIYWLLDKGITARYFQNSAEHKKKRKKRKTQSSPKLSIQILKHNLILNVKLAKEVYK
jgi:hypothetical protein